METKLTQGKFIWQFGLQMAVHLKIPLSSQTIALFNLSFN
jgi:hypothetical protein